jgi:hypothetical protein
MLMNVRFLRVASVFLFVSVAVAEGNSSMKAQEPNSSIQEAGSRKSKKRFGFDKNRTEIEEVRKRHRESRQRLAKERVEKMNAAKTEEERAQLREEYKEKSRAQSKKFKEEILALRGDGKKFDKTKDKAKKNKSN